VAAGDAAVVTTVGVIVVVIVTTHNGVPIGLIPREPG